MTKQINEKKSSYLTIRLPASIKSQLIEVSDENTRTLAAQVLHYIKRGLDKDRTEEEAI